MTKKEKFIEEISKMLEDSPEKYLSSDALDFWNGLQMTEGGGKPKFTDNGKLVLVYMQENKDNYNNLFKAKDIGEGLEISSRTASGALRKLVNDGYVDKVGEAPVIYAITDLGINTNPNE